MQPQNGTEAADVALLGLQLAEVGLWRWDPATDAIEADLQTRELCGLQQEGLVTLSMLKAQINAEDFPRLDSALRQCLQDVAVAKRLEECRCLSADGEQHWISFTASCLRGGTRASVLGTAIDITERKRSESRMARDQRQIRDDLHAQQERVASAVHDLRNSLAALQSAVHLFDRASGAPARGSGATLELQSQVGRIALILNQLLGTTPAEAVHASSPDQTNLLLPQGVQPAPVQLTRRVLVADDNADAARALAMMLRLDGHEVSIALNGQQAFDLAQESHPEVLLLDIAMPVKDGLAVAREIKAQPWGTACALIAMSGRDRVEDRDETFGAGFIEHLVKPLNFDEVSRLVAGKGR